MRRAIDERMVTVLVLFDFSKAFDWVCHGKLLGKLRKLNFSKSAILWFKNYLEGRKQAIHDTDGCISAWRDSKYGVPQGSVQGPLLFSLCLHDFNEIMNSMK